MTRVLAFLFSTVTVACCFAGDSGVQSGDAVCGSRCVHFMLEWNGVTEANLVALIRELQWPEVEAGVSMEAAAQALTDRGVASSPVSFPLDLNTERSSPMIIQLRPNEAGKLPHFVVLLPTAHQSPGVSAVWDGPSGVVTLPQDELRSRMTGFGVAMNSSVSEFTLDRAASRLTRLLVGLCFVQIGIVACLVFISLPRRTLLCFR